jgi:hypothetical protein
MTTPSPCPSCRTRTKGPGKYLCGTCWNALNPATRRLLSSSGSRAFARLRQLHRQLDAGVPLAEIRITA